MDIIERARKTNRERDAIDRKSDFNNYKAPPDLKLNEYFDIAMEAIRAGIKVKDWNCIAEAYVMMEDIGKKIERKNNGE